jgi:DNA-binding Lrp family transcriptional regulator
MQRRPTRTVSSSAALDGERKPRVISDQVKKLLTEHIDSVEQLEILLLLHESRHRTWTVDEVNERVCSSPASVRSRLDGLEQRGFIQRRNTDYRYATSSELDGVVAELARTYAERRFTVIELIFARPSDKLRAFADAFKVGSANSIKKKKDDG